MGPAPAGKARKEQATGLARPGFLVVKLFKYDEFPGRFSFPEGIMDRDWSLELVNCIRGADRSAARALVDDWATGHSLEEAVTGLLAPALEAFGRLWADSREGTSLAQGYVAAKVAEDLLARVLEQKTAGGPPPGPRKGPVVLGNIEDDYHPLGRKMVIAFLRCEGWEVHDLGVDVPAAVFVDRAEELGARVLGASAMMFSTARNVRKLREEIDRRGLGGRLQLAVGGAVFKLRPELVAEFGADGTAGNALEAPALFDRLWSRAAEAAQGGRP